MFKKLNDFILERSEEKNLSIHPKCDRCGKDETKCECHEQDYYDAKLDHYTPNGKTKKGNYHGNNN